jgi:hypothetical protein
MLLLRVWIAQSEKYDLLKDSTVGVRFPAGKKLFNFATTPRPILAHLVCRTVGIWALVLWGKAVGEWSWPLTSI